MHPFTEKADSDLLNLGSKAITIAFFLCATIAMFTTPILALSWRQLPFTGVLLEANLVVSNRTGDGWSGQMAGLDTRHLITRLAGHALNSSSEYQQTLENLNHGDFVQIFTLLRDGTVQLFPQIEITHFPATDLLKLFWLPYIIGCVYLGLGLWVYLATGQEKPGRALAFFCASVSIATLLLFDVLSTHKFTVFWLIAIAMLGGSLISLSLRFPTEWIVTRNRPWLYIIPYLLSLVLASFSIINLYHQQDPWSFIQARKLSYYYAAAASLTFFIGMFIHARRNNSVVARRQARLVLMGSLVAFSPFVVWFISPIFNLFLSFNGALLLPVLILFPISVALAIMRYRLLQVDRLVHRTLVYATLTAFLAGLFAASISLSQRAFIALTGERSDAAVVITTLFLTAVVAPIRSRIQSWIDSSMGEKNTLQLNIFGKQLSSYLEMNDPHLLRQRFLEEAISAVGAGSGAIVVRDEDRHIVTNTSGSWRNQPEISIPLVHGEDIYGLLLLGPHKKKRQYRTFDIESINRLSLQVAHSLKIMLTYGHHMMPSVDPPLDANAVSADG